MGLPETTGAEMAQARETVEVWVLEQAQQQGTAMVRASGLVTVAEEAMALKLLWGGVMQLTIFDLTAWALLRDVLPFPDSRLWGNYQHKPGRGFGFGKGYGSGSGNGRGFGRGVACGVGSGMGHGREAELRERYANNRH